MQIDDAADDIGMPSEDFVDTCDRCFVAEVCAGDARLAEKITGRSMPRTAKSPIELAAWAILTGRLAE